MVRDIPSIWVRMSILNVMANDGDVTVSIMKMQVTDTLVILCHSHCVNMHICYVCICFLQTVDEDAECAHVSLNLE